MGGCLPCSGLYQQIAAYHKFAKMAEVTSKLFFLNEDKYKLNNAQRKESKERENEKNEFKEITSYSVSSSSDIARSIGGMMGQAACPLLERAPRMHWIAERSRAVLASEPGHCSAIGLVPLQCQA